MKKTILAPAVAVAVAGLALSASPAFASTNKSSAEETTPATEESTEAAEETTPAAEESTEAAEETTPAAEESTEAAEETTEAAEPAFEVSPKKVSATDFVNKDKAVTVTVTNLEPGQNVTLKVSPKGDSNVTMLEEKGTADENGVFTYTVYGTNADNPSAYLGKYDVSVTGDGVDFAGTFEVVNSSSDNAEAGAGSSDKDSSASSDSSNSLPRTGAELGGLAAGAILLTVGAATVLVTRRKAKA